MSLFSNVIGTLITPLVMLSSYPQYMLTSFEIKQDNKVNIVEKSIGKNFGYLQEDIKIIQLIGGKNKNKVDYINKVIKKDVVPKVLEAEKISKDYFGNSINIPQFPYEIISKPIITKNNEYILSFYNDYYEFLGGAHGLTTRTSYNIDKNKENLLKLNDIFIQGYNYIDIINKQIKNEINNQPDKYFDSGDEFTGIKEDQNFYLDGDNIIIYYQLYEIAPYASGIPEFKIPLSLFDKNFIYYNNI